MMAAWDKAGKRTNVVEFRKGDRHRFTVLCDSVIVSLLSRKDAALMVRDVKCASYLLAVLLVSVTVASLAEQRAASTAKPNIIFILADDLSYWDLSCFGQKHFSTPNIDRLATQGRIFANAYAGGPWCAPSRTALLTGLNGSHTAALAHDAQKRPVKFNPTVAEMLKTAGYATCALGKWHMLEGGHHSWLRNKTWAEQKRNTIWQQMPWHRGFDVCRIGYRSGFLGGNGNPYFPFQIETGDDQEIPLPQNRNLDSEFLWRYWDKPAVAATLFNAQGRFVDKTGKDSTHMRYSEDIYREEAVAFMRTNKNRPFFLYHATPLVHGPLAVKELGEFKDKPGWTLCHKLWAGMVQELDRSVGVIMDEVKKLGLERNTIILFASDNGYAEWGYFKRKAWLDDPLFHNKGPWNRGKFITANGGVIVPFVAWGPGRVPPGKTDRAVNFYDFMVTACELAGTKLPGLTDGVSFVPLLEGRDKDQPLRPAMVWPQSTCAFTGGLTDDWEPTKKPSEEQKTYLPDALLLDERWYALVFRKQPSPSPLTIRLFDILTDPGCQHDFSRARKEMCARAIAVLRKKANFED